MVAMKDYKLGMLIILKLEHNVKVDFFVCAIKMPRYSSNKYESNFVKMHREMKTIIDEQVNIGLDSPFCYGLLVEGKHQPRQGHYQRAHYSLVGYDCYLLVRYLVFQSLTFFLHNPQFKMQPQSLTDCIWDNMKTMRLTTDLLERFGLKTRANALKEIKTCMKNIKEESITIKG